MPESVSYTHLGLLLKDDAKKPIILNIEENILSLEVASNMGSMNESMFIVKAVSYTHLDVYKRQRLSKCQ